jgi:hypothetical protein
MFAQLLRLVLFLSRCSKKFRFFGDFGEIICYSLHPLRRCTFHPMTALECFCPSISLLLPGEAS